ncbi:MAG: MFS transporter [Deltaproteobacteria bacterium]|nr:MFS transporter [Deltaproteobacteria bacterium]
MVQDKKKIKTIIASQYFLYFGVMGISLPYFNLYCYHINLSGFEIGILSATRSLTMILFPIMWSIIADRFNARRPIYILCNFVSAGIWAFYLYTDHFQAMLLITICYGFFFTPVISFLEAFTMDILAGEKKSYGRIRVWGTISFILVTTFLGVLIDYFPIKIIIILILAGSLVQALISTKIPGTVIRRDLNRREVKKFLNKRLLIFLFCGFLMLMSHGAYYCFFSIHLKRLGYGNTFIGIAWALASVSEILVMVNSDRIFRKISLEKVLLFSFIAAALRWFILYSTESPYLILFSQIFHAITYGTFHMASILYIDMLTDDFNKTFGQAVNNAVSYGLGMMVGFLLSGYLYGKIGSPSLFLMSRVIALIGGIGLWGFGFLTGKSVPVSN